MAVWLPVLKAALPYITQIVSAAIPAFTSKHAREKAADVVPKQIEELQTAVIQNAETVKALATQLKETLEGIDASAATLHQEIKVLKRLAAAAVILALSGASVAVWALLSRPGV
jgi:ABC-type hemin transport system substrate-binding protein